MKVLNQTWHIPLSCRRVSLSTLTVGAARFWCLGWSVLMGADDVTSELSSTSDVRSLRCVTLLTDDSAILRPFTSVGVVVSSEQRSLMQFIPIKGKLNNDYCATKFNHIWRISIYAMPSYTWRKHNVITDSGLTESAIHSGSVTWYKYPLPLMDPRH